MRPTLGGMRSGTRVLERIVVFAPHSLSSPTFLTSDRVCILALAKPGGLLFAVEQSSSYEMEALPSADEAARRLDAFLAVIGDERERDKDVRATAYYDAARSASNDRRQRITRIAVLREVITGGS